MPYYDFEDTETGEVFELSLKIAEKEDFLNCLLYTSDAADE